MQSQAVLQHSRIWIFLSGLLSFQTLFRPLFFSYSISLKCQTVQAVMKKNIKTTQSLFVNLSRETGSENVPVLTAALR